MQHDDSPLDRHVRDRSHVLLHSSMMQGFKGVAGARFVVQHLHMRLKHEHCHVVPCSTVVKALWDWDIAVLSTSQNAAQEGLAGAPCSSWWYKDAVNAPTWVA